MRVLMVLGALAAAPFVAAVSQGGHDAQQCGYDWHAQHQTHANNGKHLGWAKQVVPCPPPAPQPVDPPPVQPPPVQPPPVQPPPVQPPPDRRRPEGHVLSAPTLMLRSPSLDPRCSPRGLSARNPPRPWTSPLRRTRPPRSRR